MRGGLRFALPDVGKIQENATMRPIEEIAREIARDWKNPHFAAKPYLRAMLLGDFGHDGEKSVVLYFLSNASTWRGDVARRVKAELKERAIYFNARRNIELARGRA